jgi:hypothetical protein
MGEAAVPRLDSARSPAAGAALAGPASLAATGAAAAGVA